VAWRTQPPARPRRPRGGCSAQDRFGLAPFLKISPDGRQFWMSRKLADDLSVYEGAPSTGFSTICPLGEQARPNHAES
jgi:hypothetical protein